MEDRKGFTLVELIVVMVVIATVAAFILPNFFVSMEKTRAQTAKNNLLAISTAEQKYFEDYGIYYTGSGLAAISSSLHLGMSTSDQFTYSCAAGSPYLCTATDNTVTLTTSGSGVTCTVGGASCPP